MKTHGWVLFDTDMELYVESNLLGCAKLKDALVFETRRDARKHKIAQDRVRKVSLTKNGRPKVIIGKG